MQLEPTAGRDAVGFISTPERIPIMSAKPVHLLFVRTPDGTRIPVAVQPILDELLARQTASLIAENLAEETDTYLSAPRFLFTAWDAIKAAGADRFKCVIELERKTGTRVRIIERFPVTLYVQIRKHPVQKAKSKAA
jgi:hypothetical protein